MKKINIKYIIGALVIIAIIVLAILWNPSPNPQEISYNQFLESVEVGLVKRVYLDNSSDQILGEYNDGGEFITDNPRIDSLKESLLIQDIIVEEKNRGIQGEQLFSMVLTLSMIGVLLFFANRNASKQKQGMAGKTSFSAVLPENVNTKFNDVAGNDEAKESVQEIVDFIKNPEKYAQYGARLPRGVIFYGSPGTGKTLMAKAVAGESEVPFIAVSGSDFVQMYVGVGASRIRDLFKRARSYGKCVIFIDEIDALGKKRDGGLEGGGNDERDQTLNALLSEMSGFGDNEGIVVIAATNR
ncbi:MAG: ATP-dependent metallopeptidase FtsH/Yme1/Tma family protein, partial [Clostridiales bacterium]|nr:ATP-dependent metallopeptidase FtsH/Yme1/Tma family protein [Clostridiales bacterium]